MKKLFILFFLLTLTVISAGAQSAADKIVGTYRAKSSNDISKVKISKVTGGYRAQIIWLEHPNLPDGTPRTDKHNPEQSLRNVHSDRIVLVEKMTYKDGVWGNAKIYDPTKGKKFNVEMRFKDPKTLLVKGSLLVFSKTMTWTKID